MADDIELAVQTLQESVGEWTREHAVRLIDAVALYAQEAPPPSSPDARAQWRSLRDTARELVNLDVPASPARGKQRARSASPARRSASPARRSASPARPARTRSENPAASAPAAAAAPPDLHTIARRRFAKITAAITNACITSHELSALIIDGVPPGKHEVLENVAFVRLYRGYTLPHAPGPVWGRFGHPEEYPSIAEMCKESMQIVSRDIHTRIVDRRRMLLRDPTGSSWLLDLVHKIETILYQRDYDAQIQGAGGAARGRKIIDDEFRDWAAVHVAGLDVNDAAAGGRQQALDKFAAIRKDQVRTSTRIFLLYTSLGPGVLLDPGWRLDSCYHRATKSFLALVKIAKAEPAGQYTLERVYAYTLATLLSLARHVGGPVVEKYVRWFVEQCPSDRAPRA
ncbi:hypothetical protein FA95DRAFT_1610714 [Auriscalpium vulgare]|uniref:Uncharacterized protein n=1 Tax=Auriscalpium vulgare TaxID=40419 RepID=A0ACB8RC85_9AGAM|nr:hypothetical protein FA95DRAFT_1610714 [Auriscalpium vulgare]